MIRFRTVSGRAVDLERPTPDDILIGDIACGLSRICRYYGQLRQFYSVAQHSLIVASLVEPQYRLAALLHDASEAYLGDISRNLKHSPVMVGYRALEERWTDVIEAKFALALTPEARDHIKAADDLVAVMERTLLRKGRKWLAATEIHEAIMDGWVRGSFDELLALSTGSDNIKGIRDKPPFVAERDFLNCYSYQSGDYTYYRGAHLGETDFV